MRKSGSYKATAKRFGVADDTMRRICKNEPEISQIAAQKKAENTADMLSFMDSRKRKAQNAIDNCLDILPKKLGEASAAQVATEFYAAFTFPAESDSRCSVTC